MFGLVGTRAEDPVLEKAFDFVEAVQASAGLIRRHQSDSGAYPAAPRFSNYRFSWLRDGAFIADAMSRGGAADSADRFFGWCSHVLESRQDRVAQLVGRSRRGDLLDRSDLLPAR